jgi:3-oxoacyl-[acyl-carrier protein] reductase
MTDGFELTGRRALITGGSTGIGAETARRFVKAGATVSVVARRPEHLLSLSSELGDACVTIQADLSDGEQLETVVPRAIEQMGGLDTVVNAAARADWMPFEELNRDTFDRMFALNVWAPYRIAQMARAHLLASEHPVVVMIGSVDAERPSPGAVAYGATKAALTASTVALAKELAPIRFVQVNPGLVDTPMVADVKADIDTHGDRFNLAGRFGRPEEIAGMIHYLVSPLGRFANGNVFRVDGGALVLGPFDATRRRT